MKGSINKGDLDNFLQELLWEKNVNSTKGDAIDVLRLKGVISVDDSDKRLVIQAVHELYDSHFTTAWESIESRKNIIVFIGRHLDRKVLEAKFQALVKQS